jgi:hypothetical protein
MIYPGTKMVRYEFPLRPDCTVVMVLPNDLTVAETRRLKQFMLSLIVAEAIDPTP